MDPKDLILEKIAELETKLEAPDLSEAAIDQIASELEELMNELQKDLM
jgi:hypothetical protein